MVSFYMNKSDQDYLFVIKIMEFYFFLYILN